MERSSKSGPRRRSSKKMTAPIMSEIDLARLGDGVVAYIRTMSSEEAQERFPSIDNLPRGLTLYALHAADGTPIALTDTRQAAMSHALGDDLARTGDEELGRGAVAVISASSGTWQRPAGWGRRVIDRAGSAPRGRPCRRFDTPSEEPVHRLGRAD